MRQRGLVAAALSAVLVAAGPAHAEQVVEGAWSQGWRAWNCDAGPYVWRCDYTFGSSSCVETSVGVVPDAGVRLGCDAWLQGQATIQPRINSAGKRVGCLSSVGAAEVDYYSSYPGMSHEDIPVDLDVHDGEVVATGHFVTPDGDGVSRTYDIQVSFLAGCGAGTFDFGDALDPTGSVTIDVA